MRMPISLTSFLITASCLLLQACASSPAVRVQEFDFAPINLAAVSTASTAPNAPQAPVSLTVSLSDINAPAALDSNAMLYRLQYDNPQSLRPYAQIRWTMSPAKLLTQRVKTRIAAAGINVVSAGDGIVGGLLLRIDLDEFSQVFSASSTSVGQLNLRVSVIKGRSFLAQRSFQKSVTAVSSDAPGGAKALQDASDAVIAEIVQWMQTLPSKAPATPLTPITP